MQQSHLTRAFLKGTSLANTIFTESPKYWTQLKQACYWEQAKYFGQWDLSKDPPEWVITEAEKKKNQDLLDKIRDDATSNPGESPDCSRWE